MNFTKLMIFLAAFTSTAATAGLTCPATVRINAPLRITATVTNSDCRNSLTINNSVLSLLGNSGSGTIGLRGPFVKPVLSTLIPAATCRSVPNVVGHPEFGTHTIVTERSQAFSNLLVISSVPAGMTGTLAVVSAGVMDTHNELHMAGVCNIRVTN